MAVQVDKDWERLPFDKAIDYFRGKIPISTDRYDELWREYQDVAFTIAGVTQASLLEETQAMITKALEEGTGIQEFKKGFNEAAAKAGWTGATPYRVQLIFTQNLRNAYSAGRYQQLDDPDVKRLRPYRIYRHRDSRMPRPLHLSWDGLVLSADDPFWESHPVPGGFGCKCGIFSLSQRDLQRMGKSGPDSAPDDGFYTYKDKVTGEARKVPKGIDPGFDHKPGSTPAEQRQRLLQQGLSRLSPTLQRLVQQNGNQD